MTAAEPLLKVSKSSIFIPEDNDSLRDDITRLAGHINAAEYRFIKLLAELVKRNAWLGESGLNPHVSPD